MAPLLLTVMVTSAKSHISEAIVGLHIFDRVCLHTNRESVRQEVWPIMLRFGSRLSDHYFLGVCLFACLFVCLCRVFLSRLRSDLDQTRTHVTCPGPVVSPRI